MLERRRADRVLWDSSRTGNGGDSDYDDNSGFGRDDDGGDCV